MNKESTSIPPESQQEWSCEPGSQLVIPEEVTAKLRYKVTAYLPESHLTIWCAAHVAESARLTLCHCLVDTSERYQGVTLRERRTWHPEIILVNVPTVIVPIKSEERA